MHMRDFIGVEKQSGGYTLTWTIRGERDNPKACVTWSRWTFPKFGSMVSNTVAEFNFSLREIRKAVNEHRLRAYIHEEMVIQQIAGPDNG